jgi:hypothetical protein
MLKAWEVRAYYRNAVLHVPRLWNISRKHVRIETLNHRFVKLNRFENRINTRELRGYCIKYAPLHVYFSVLDWLFPERVGRKYKARYAVPIGGEYVVDIDSYVIHRRHKHRYAGKLGVCYDCIEISRNLAVQACERIEEYYSKATVVFSGRRGFHIHVLDFNIRDWTHYNEKNPVKSHEVARLKFSSLLALETYTFDRHHFILSVDPMRVMSVPQTLNAETSLICLHIGNRKDLDACSARAIIERANPALQIYGYPEPIRAVKTALR